MADTSGFDWMRVLVIVATGIAAALGVQANPSARPDDVRSVVREEVQPLRDAIGQVRAEQHTQALRLHHLEARLPTAASPVAL